MAPLITEKEPFDPGRDPFMNQINGRFIIDGQHFLREIRSLEHHRERCLKSNKAWFKLIKFSVKALVWTLEFECPYCYEKRIITSEPIATNNCIKTSNKIQHANDHKMLSICDSAVWGIVSSGGGYRNIEEIFSFLGIKCINKATFNKLENKMGECWKSVLSETIISAGIEERKLAIQNGDITDAGVPYITVIVDGGWSHRSHGHRYTANSGVACVIGLRTKKLLYVGVRNKYCYMCQYLLKNNKPTSHDGCFKNWDGSSPGMESDMIVEAFKLSLEMHGVEYRTMIGDGDSSVYVKVRENVPYGRNVIKKECANHVIKCYTKSLFKVQLEIKNRKKLLTNKTILKLKYMARRTIANNYKMGFDVDTLREDLKNGPRHIFGDHKMCKEYYCKIDKNESNSLSIEMQKVLERVEDVLKPLVRKAPQLLTNDTSNLAENFMSLVAKFTGGKQISRGKKG